jgi:CRP-like cAMP-binding protein
VLRNPEVRLKTTGLFGKRLEEYEDRLSDLIRNEVPARLDVLLLRLSEHEGAMAGEGCRRVALATPTGSWRAWLARIGRRSPGR